MLAAAAILELGGHEIAIMETGAATCAPRALHTYRPQGERPPAPAAALHAVDQLVARSGAQLVLADADFSGLLPMLRRAPQCRPAIAVIGLRPWGARPGWLCPEHGAPAPQPDRYLQLGVPALPLGICRPPAGFSFLGALGIQAAPGATRRDANLVLVSAGFGRARANLLGTVRNALAGMPGIEVVDCADPQRCARLMTRAAMVVSPPCLGSIVLALQAGVPVLCTGVCSDARLIAAALAASGAGLGLAMDLPDVRTLRRAAAALLRFPRFAHAAAALSMEFDEFQAAPRLLAMCDELLAPMPSRVAHVGQRR